MIHSYIHVKLFWSLTMKQNNSVLFCSPVNLFHFSLTHPNVNFKLFLLLLLENLQGKKPEVWIISFSYKSPLRKPKTTKIKDNSFIIILFWFRTFIAVDAFLGGWPSLKDYCYSSLISFYPIHQVMRCRVVNNNSNIVRFRWIFLFRLVGIHYVFYSQQSHHFLFAHASLYQECTFSFPFMLPSTACLKLTYVCESFSFHYFILSL